MNAEIAKEMTVLAAYGALLNEATEDEAAVDAEVGEEAMGKIAEYADVLNDDDTSYNAIFEEFLRQQVRESAARLLALISAEETEEVADTGEDYDETAAE